MKKCRAYLPEILFFALLALWVFLLGCLIKRNELSYGLQIAVFLAFLADSAVLIPLLIVTFWLTPSSAVCMFCSFRTLPASFSTTARFSLSMKQV